MFTFRFEIFVCLSSAYVNNSEISGWNGQGKEDFDVSFGEHRRASGSLQRTILMKRG